MYSSQYEQDKWLNENVFHNKKHGLFVDIGAHDGKTINNTIFFEKELSWDGLCIEPIPQVYTQLKKNRSADTIEGCAWIKNTEKIFNVIEGYSEMLSGFEDSYDEEHRKRIASEVKTMKQKVHKIPVKCYDINDLLGDLKKKYPNKPIDLISIDTEGSEEEILRHIDYKQFDIRSIVMENNYEHQDIRNFLKSKGYEFVTRLEIDDVFVKMSKPKAIIAKLSRRKP